MPQKKPTRTECHTHKMQQKCHTHDTKAKQFFLRCNMSQSEVNFNIELYCESLQSTEIVSLSFPAIPRLFDEIRDAVEEKYSIPSCSQIIWIGENRIEPSSSVTLASFYLQSGDTMKISFQTKCDCKSVKETIEWLTECIEIVLKIKKSETKETVTTLYEEHNTTLDDNRHATILVENLFVPWLLPETQMNAFYFNHLDGISLLVKLHKEISSLRNSNLFSTFHSVSEYLECKCCVALGNVASDTAFRRRVTVCGGLETCLATFMAHPVDDLQHIHVLDSVILAVCNLADIPENQIYISQKKEVINQILSVIGSPLPAMKQYTSMAVAILGNLVQAKEAHQYMLKEDLVVRVVDSVVSQSSVATSKMQGISLKYGTGIMLSQMVLGSMNLLKSFNRSTLLKMMELLEDVFKVDPMEIGRHEKENGMTWGSFLPLVFLYEPKLCQIESCENSSELCHLHQQSTDLILYALEASLWRQEHVEVLVEDQLLDYVVMLPWFVPAQSKDRSVTVVNTLAKVRQIDPPSLSTICRGKLSTTSFGLYDLMKFKSLSQLTEHFNT